MTKFLGAGLTLRGAALLAVIAGAVGLIFAMTTQSGASSQMQSPFDQYVGFGRTDDSIARDNKIALWEAFKREQYVASCMRDAGFHHQPSPEYPPAEVIAVADRLAVVPLAEGPSPKSANEDYVATLEPTDRDDYYMTLYGESASSMDQARARGGEGVSDDFATGGCVGNADKAIGSIWDLRRSVEGDMTDLRSEVASLISDAYGDCAAKFGVSASNPGDLERIEPSGTSSDDDIIEKVLTGCVSVWDSEHARVEAVLGAEFIQRHQAQFDRQWETYTEVEAEISQDTAFLTYIADASARYEAEDAAKQD